MCVCVVQWQLKQTHVLNRQPGTHCDYCLSVSLLSHSLTHTHTYAHTSACSINQVHHSIKRGQWVHILLFYWNSGPISIQSIVVSMQCSSLVNIVHNSMKYRTVVCPLNDFPHCKMHDLWNQFYCLQLDSPVLPVLYLEFIFSYLKKRKQRMSKIDDTQLLSDFIVSK